MIPDPPNPSGKPPTPSAAIPFRRSFCGHSKFRHGCPSCAVRWLKAKGVVSIQPFTGNVAGLVCLRRNRGS
jgi:hypothetical protein